MKHNPSWTPRPRSDIIPWNSSLCQKEMDDNFNIDSMTDDFTRQAYLQIIKDSWDSFSRLEQHADARLRILYRYWEFKSNLLLPT